MPIPGGWPWSGRRRGPESGRGRRGVSRWAILDAQAELTQVIDEQKKDGVVFTPEQRKWLDAIRDHIAASLSIDAEDLSDVPFNQMGGLGKAHQLFGDRLAGLLDDLNTRLAA